MRWLAAAFLAVSLCVAGCGAGADSSHSQRLTPSQMQALRGQLGILAAGAANTKEGGTSQSGGSGPLEVPQDPIPCGPSSGDGAPPR